AKIQQPHSAMPPQEVQLRVRRGRGGGDYRQDSTSSTSSSSPFSSASSSPVSSQIGAAGQPQCDSAVPVGDDKSNCDTTAAPGALAANDQQSPSHSPVPATASVAPLTTTAAAPTAQPTATSTTTSASSKKAN